MDLAGLFEWFPHHNSSSSDPVNAALLPKLSPQKWQAIVNAYKVNQRLTIAPVREEQNLTDHTPADEALVDQTLDYQRQLLCDAETTLLMLDEQQQQARVSIPLVASPVYSRANGSGNHPQVASEDNIKEHSEEASLQNNHQQKLPQRLHMQLKQPGRYRHWHITANVIEQNTDSNRLYATLKPTEMVYREDRRLHSRFRCEASPHLAHERQAKVFIDMQDGKRVIIGKVDNISLGGMCFIAPLDECNTLNQRFLTLGIQLGNAAGQALKIPSEILEVSTPLESSAGASSKTLQIRAKFANLNVQQKDALMHFMGTHPIAEEMDILQ